MNEHASAAAWFSPILKGNALVIMQALAYLADDFDGQVTVKVERLCEMTRMSRRTVQRALRELETLTFIERTGRHAAGRGRGGQAVATEYRVRTGMVSCETASFKAQPKPTKPSHRGNEPKACSKCGVMHTRSHRYCLKCANVIERARRKEKPRRFADMDDAQLQKARARGAAKMAQKRGKLMPQPCEKCGIAKAEKHHDDYAKPLEVRWLCRTCHLAHHKAEKVAA